LRGSEEVLQKFRAEIAAANCKEKFMSRLAVRSAPAAWHNMVVHPDGTWYSGVTVNDVAEIVEQHLVGGKVVERLAWLDTTSCTRRCRNRASPSQASGLTRSSGFVEAMLRNRSPIRRLERAIGNGQVRTQDPGTVMLLRTDPRVIVHRIGRCDQD
jgi:hypothetical protein